MCLSSGLWKNNGSDPDAIWHGRSDRARDEAGLGMGIRQWEGVISGANMGHPIETNVDFAPYVV